MFSKLFFLILLVSLLSQAAYTPTTTLSPETTKKIGVVGLEAGSQVTVSGTTLATGASTSALQSAGNTSMASIDVKTPALGQALAAGSVPIVLTAAQLSTLTPLSSVSVSSSVLPTGGSTSAWQSSSDATLSLIKAKTDNIDVLLSTRTKPADTQAVSAVSLPLPAGASTSANQSTIDASINTLLKPASSLAQVTLVPNVTTVGTITNPVTVNSHAVTNAGTFATQATLQAGSAIAGKFGIDQTTPGTTNLVSIGTNGTVTANAGTNLNTSLLALEAGGNLATIKTDVDNLNLAQGSTTAGQKGNLQLGAVTSGAPAYTTAQSSPLSLDAAGNLRVISTASGTTAVSMATAPALVASAAIIGKVGIDQTTPGTTNGVAINGKTAANAPARNDYTSTSVTTAAYTQLVASTSNATTEIEIFDSSGQTLALATGAAASEVIQIYIFPGGNGRVPLTIAAGTRVSVKAISATASIGELDINFYK